MGRRGQIVIVVILYFLLVIFCLYKELFLFPTSVNIHVTQATIISSDTNKSQTRAEHNNTLNAQTIDNNSSDANETNATLVMPLADEINATQNSDINQTIPPLASDANCTINPESNESNATTFTQKEKLISLCDDINISLPTKMSEPSFMARKESNRVILSGELALVAEKKGIVKQFELFSKNVESDELIVNAGLLEAKWTPFVEAIAHDFIRIFEKGSLEYKDKKFIIKGIVLSNLMQEEFEKILYDNTLEGYSIENNVTIVTPATAKQGLKKELFDALHEQDVKFNTNSTVISKESTPLLNTIAKILNKYKKYSISIEGHTDSDGDDLHNLQLSHDRAGAVKEYLKKQGIAKSRIETVGYGETKPILPNTTQENKQINRRVEFKIRGE